MTESRRPRGSKTSRFGTNSRISHDASAYYGSRLYAELPAAEEQAHAAGPAAENPLPEEVQNRILPGSSERMAELPDRCLHLMITSPPYNVTKEYDDDLTLREYLALLERVFAEIYRVLVEGGRACINVANLGRKPYIPLSDHISHLMTQIGFHMRGEIIWAKGAGAGVSMAWGSWQSASNPVLRDTHEYILVFCKGAYSRPARGRQSTITREQFMEWTKSVWTMPTESARKVGHPAPFPLELPARLVQLYTYAGDVVLDPFMGSGTTAIAARQAGRVFVGYETNADYRARAEARIAAALAPTPARRRAARGDAENNLDNSAAPKPPPKQTPKE
jgi:site-specific DNA-methyltransferase (adenine-specific)